MESGSSIISAASGSLIAQVEAKAVLGASAVFVTPSALALEPREEASLVSPDGTRLYAVSFSGEGVRVWNLETGAPERTLPDLPGTDVAISSDGRFLYVLHSGFDFEDRLYIADVASGARLREVILGGLARRIAVSLDGTAIITNENSVGDAPGWVDFVR